MTPPGHFLVLMFPKFVGESSDIDSLVRLLASKNLSNESRLQIGGYADEERSKFRYGIRLSDSSLLVVNGDLANKLSEETVIYLTNDNHLRIGAVSGRTVLPESNSLKQRGSTE